MKKSLESDEKKLVSDEEKEESGTRAERGAATERILDALAEEYPNVHNRDSFINSTALARKFKKTGELSEPEKTSASRTLGRLISEGIVRETLFLQGSKPKVDLKGAGLVSVSINLDRLSQEHKRWKGDLSKGISSAKPEPTQEVIVEDIIENTRAWNSNSDDKHRLLLINISIVHGSGDFDLLILVLYRNYDEYMRYVRDVIQRVEFVQKTHTMQIGGWEGFPEIEKPIVTKLKMQPVQSSPDANPTISAA
jgi:DNA-binding Lrp family transcriptional regulator